MPNESDGPVLVFSNSVSDINAALLQLQEKVDAMRGLRGDAQIFAATTVGAPSAEEQAARLADLPSEQPSSPLYWLLGPRIAGAAPAPTALTDNTGGAATDTLAALGGITALTDSSGGTADNTIAAIPDPADTPATVDALRDDLVANTLPAVRNAVADLAAKVNVLIGDMNDARDNLASVAAKLNTLMTQLKTGGVLL